MLQSAFRMFLALSVLTGILYPLLITLFSFVLSKDPFVYYLDRKVGATLIGQSFEQPRYFSGRPSASQYNTLIAGSSNLGPTSQQLRKMVALKNEELKVMHNLQNAPADLLFSSASGLDPHITKEAALYQADSIARSRMIDLDKIKKLIEKETNESSISFFIKPYVNVLLLNIALDKLSEKEEEIQ